MKAVEAAFNQEKALEGAFYVIMNLRMELFEALVDIKYQHVYTMKGYWLLLLNELEPKRTEVKTIDRRRRLEQWGPALAMGGAGLQLQFTKSPLKKRWYRL